MVVDKITSHRPMPMLAQVGGMIPAHCSALGRAILAHYGLNCENPASWLYLEEGKAYGSMEAVIRVGTRLGGRWRSVALLRLLPPRARDWLYRWLAANRYRLFGRADMCAAPDPELRRRLLL